MTSLLGIRTRLTSLLANAVLTFNPAVPQEHAVGF